MEAAEDLWLHALLGAVKARTGWAVLINTSFNTRGRPILNTAAEALALLRDCEGLDAVSQLPPGFAAGRRETRQRAEEGKGLARGIPRGEGGLEGCLPQGRGDAGLEVTHKTMPPCPVPSGRA